MHPAQLKAIRYVDESISFLARKLMAEYDICEDDALELLYDTEDLVDSIQEGHLTEVYKKAKVRAVNLPNNPKEFYPGHHAYTPPATFPGAFNAHMAQAMSPYVLAIAKKIAKDRGLEPPNEQQVMTALEKTDWAKAAYEAKKMPKYPGLAKVRAFIYKYLGKPLERVTDKIPVDRMFGLVASSAVMWVIWTTFKDRLESIGAPPFELFQTYGDLKQQRILVKLRKELKFNGR